MSREHDYHALLVSDIVEETADARSFVLDVPPALAARFAYRAGQFCTFRAIVDGQLVVRCYSMSSSPDTGEPLTVTVKRVPGGAMSNWMNDALGRGDTIDVLPPAGLFVLRAADTPIVAFAGGSGITPVLSIVKSALATTAREIALVYANRDRGSVIFADTLADLAARFPGRLSVRHHFDADRGFLDAAACAALAGDRTDADVYVCGPAPFMSVVAAGLERRGFDRAQVVLERFDLDDTAPASSKESETESIVIRIDGRKHAVRYERGDSILQTARRAGLKPPFSCQGGNCGTCMALVVAGEATMRVNNALTAEEIAEGWVLTCQAIPLSREVVVDYEG